MVILTKVELIQGLLAIDLHVTFEPIKYPHTFHDLLQDCNSLCMVIMKRNDDIMIFTNF